MQQRQATRRAVNHAPSRRDIGRHLAAVAHQPFARPRRKRRHPFAAQVAASPLPIKHLHLVQATRLIALEPRPYRVVVEIERFRDLGTVPAIVQQQNRVRPERHTVGLTRMPHHRLRGRAFLGARKSTANHVQRRIYPRTDRKDFAPVSKETGYRSLILATRIRAVAEAMVFSQSLASLRHRLSQAKVRSTNHRLGRILKPWAVSDRVMISSVQLPISSRAALILSTFNTRQGSRDLIQG